MPRVLSVERWRRNTGRTIERLHEETGYSVRALIRYLNGQRPWPFELTRTLKKLSRGALVDASFVAEVPGGHNAAA